MEIENLSNVALLEYYRDMVVCWWKDEEDISAELEYIATEIRKRMRGYDTGRD